MASPNWLWCACAVAMVVVECDAAVRYVNAGLTTGANNGTSWANAYRGSTGLASALAASQANDEIWVAAGTYFPAAAGNRAATFTLKSNVKLFGGFVGNETVRTQRDHAHNLTILSGDLNGDDLGTQNRTENAYHVIAATSSTINNAEVVGFHIRGGNANGPMNMNQDRGGAMLLLGNSRTYFTDCTFTSNTCTFGGGAGYVNGCIAGFTGCTFENNNGGTYGGAFDTNAASTHFFSCVFRNNTAWRAGAVEVYGQTNTSNIVNCVFQGNTATGNNGGGALWIGQMSTAWITICTIISNQANAGQAGGVQASSNVEVRNTILWDNTGAAAAEASRQITSSGNVSVAYSCVQGGASGVDGNISADPLLIPNGLRWGSPCIDAGSGSALTADFPFDVAGRPREVDDPAIADTGLSFQQRGVPDIGAFEFQRSSCVADVSSGSGATPDGAITIEDLLQYLVWFEGGDVSADVDNGAASGVPDEGVEISDLLYFLGRFEGGC